MKVSKACGVGWNAACLHARLAILGVGIKDREIRGLGAFEVDRVQRKVLGRLGEERGINAGYLLPLQTYFTEQVS